jgi:hypothetical protein
MKLITIAILALSTTANAGIKWDSLEVSKQTISTDGIDDLEGYSFGGTKLIGDSLILTASKQSYGSEVYISGNRVDIDMEDVKIGFGSRIKITDKVDFFGTISNMQGKFKVSVLGYSAALETTSTRLDLGFKSMTTPNIELTGVLGLSDMTNDKSIGVSAYYYVTGNFSIGAGYEKTDGVKGVQMGARVNF